VIYATNGHSLVEKLSFSSLWGEGYAISHANGCGYIELNTTIENEQFYEPKALVIKARFPSRRPIIDQAYSIIAQNLDSMLNATRVNWGENFSDSVDEDYLRYAAKCVAQGK
jgi:hypothetical protein